MEITKSNVHIFIMPFQYILGYTNVDKLAVLQGWKKAKKIMGAGHNIKGSISSCHPFHLVSLQSPPTSITLCVILDRIIKALRATVPRSALRLRPPRSITCQNL